jgi:hypothetical protein
MDDFNRTSRFSFGGSGPLPVNRLARYFSDTVSDPFERAKGPHGPRPVRNSAGWAPVRLGHRQPLTEEDLRIHAWLNERLAVVHYERHGLRPRANRLLRAIARFLLWPFGRTARFHID